jgi:hypothetical protein
VASNDEMTIHQRLVEALEAGVRNRDWFVWLGVNVTGEVNADAIELGKIVQFVEDWLGGLDPDTKYPEPPDAAMTPDNIVYFEFQAIAKKPQARGTRPLVGNPVPAFAYYAGS